MYTQEEINLITLSSFPELSYKSKFNLLHGLESAEPDFENHENLLIKTLTRGVYNKVKEKFSDADYRSFVLTGLDKKGVTCVTYFSSAYPDCIRHIPDPPLVLYCKGDTHLLKSKCFTVVGSRRTPPQTLALCEKLSGELSRAFTIVSGIADGADTAALKGAIDVGGRVICVLANGFDYVYPACNAQLLKSIQTSDLAVTEYPPDVQAKFYNFFVRNRILAGLSLGTLVVSAGLKSGALNTANHATGFGKDVFALPSAPNTESGKGCNLLIKNGAYLTENILDIFGVYGLDFNKPVEKPLSEAERTVYDALSSSGAALLSELAQSLRKNVYELIPAISSLEIKKLVKNLGGNRYCVI